jgi:DNA-binding response OmpR family regulator
MRAKVLFVDDEEDIREIARISLQIDPEFEVLCCETGNEALFEAAQWQPDIILLDVMMPGLDGPDTLKRLRQSRRSAEIPVVFITARTQAHQVSHYLAMGALGVIAKPFDPMTLAKDVSRFLQARTPKARDG